MGDQHQFHCWVHQFYQVAHHQQIDMAHQHQLASPSLRNTFQHVPYFVIAKPPEQGLWEIFIPVCAVRLSIHRIHVGDAPVLQSQFI